MANRKKITRRIAVAVVCVLALALVGRIEPVSAQDQTDAWRSVGPYIPSGVEAATYELAIDTQAPTTMYVGTRGGVFKTTDGGGRWFGVNTGLPAAAIVDALAIDPQHPATLYVGITLPSVFEPFGAGIFKTDDGGDSWRSMAGLEN